MVMDEYMCFDATLEEYDGMDDDTHMSSFKEARTIKVYDYGANKFIRDSESGTVVSAKTYLTLEVFPLKSKLNGQTVKQINEYHDGWDSGVDTLYEVYTWD